MTGSAAIGIVHLKPEQNEAITAFTGGRDVFVSLPTDFGKSVCYGCLHGLFARLRMQIVDCTGCVQDQL